MADRISKERRSENMRRIKSKDMKPEMIVRQIVHSMGYRYRLHRRDLPGKPDLVFGPKRKVIFVHGCFWHQHTCRDGRIPETRRDYWEPKLLRNVQRDLEAMRKLEEADWNVLVIWECDTKDIERVSKSLQIFLK